MLTGATGFLGTHVLREFLERENGILYCLVRSDNNKAEERLLTLLAYYFSNTYKELLGSRLVVVPGDVSDSASLKSMTKFPINTIINCAASVKHFSAGNEIEEINVGGPSRLIELCRATGAKFVQVSTTSVAGHAVDDSPPEKTLMNEQMLWFGQNLDHQYVGSKFRAERLALSAMAADPEKIAVKIMRVGNLMGRHSDGEFQLNSNSNSFVGRFRAYRQIGCVPYEVTTFPTEFAPVDCTAAAILTLAQTPKENCLFHPYNDHGIFIGDVLDAMQRRGINIAMVEQEEFEKALRLVMRDERRVKYLTPIIAYLNQAGAKRTALKTENTYTSQALRRFGFHWPITTDAYLDKFIEGLDTLGFFDRD